MALFPTLCKTSLYSSSGEASGLFLQKAAWAGKFRPDINLFQFGNIYIWDLIEGHFLLLAALGCAHTGLATSSPYQGSRAAQWWFLCGHRGCWCRVALLRTGWNSWRHQMLHEGPSGCGIQSQLYQFILPIYTCPKPNKYLACCTLLSHCPEDSSFLIQNYMVAARPLNHSLGHLTLSGQRHSTHGSGLQLLGQ